MNIQDIYVVIDSLASKGKIFSNEQDFQFEFALALRALPDVKEIKLEALSLSQDWNTIKALAGGKGKITRDKKEYTDIILKTKVGEHIAIELKLKTPNKICYYHTKKSGDVVTMVQDAHHLNAYDFIEDISRLENISQRYFSKSFDIAKGYAILLTNNFNYRCNDFSESAIWKNYALNEGQILGPGPLKFCNNSPYTYQTSKATYKAINLRGSYHLEWRDYKLGSYNDYQDKSKGSNPGFSYLVVEIAPDPRKSAHSGSRTIKKLKSE